MFVGFMINLAPMFSTISAHHIVYCTCSLKASVHLARMTTFSLEFFFFHISPTDGVNRLAICYDNLLYILSKKLGGCTFLLNCVLYSELLLELPTTSKKCLITF